MQSNYSGGMETKMVAFLFLLSLYTMSLLWYTILRLITLKFFGRLALIEYYYGLIILVAKIYL